MITHGSKKRFTPKDFLLEFSTTAKEGTKAAQPPSEDWKRLKMIAMMFTAASKADSEKPSRKGRRK